MVMYFYYSNYNRILFRFRIICMRNIEWCNIFIRKKTINVTISYILNRFICTLYVNDKNYKLKKYEEGKI